MRRTVNISYPFMFASGLPQLTAPMTDPDIVTNDASSNACYVGDRNASRCQRNLDFPIDGVVTHSSRSKATSLS